MVPTEILTDTVRLSSLDGGEIPARRYVWRGPGNVPVFALENCRDIVSTGVDVVVESPCEAVVLCERSKTGAGVIPSTNHGFTRWRIYGNGLVDTGFWQRATIDENNEHLRLDCVTVYGCDVGVTFEGQQCKENMLTHCRFETCDVAVNAESGFQWIGGVCAVAKEAIILTRVGEPVVVQGVGFEACVRMLVTGGPSTASQPVSLIGCRFEADQLHEDGNCIVMRHAGAITITGSRFGGGDQLVPRIALLGVGEQAVELRGNTFGAFGANKVCPVRKGAQATPKISWGRNFYYRTQAEIAKDGRNVESKISWPASALA